MDDLPVEPTHLALIHTHTYSYSLRGLGGSVGVGFLPLLVHMV